MSPAAPHVGVIDVTQVLSLGRHTSSPWHAGEPATAQHDSPTRPQFVGCEKTKHPLTADATNAATSQARMPTDPNLELLMRGPP